MRLYRYRGSSRPLRIMSIFVEYRRFRIRESTRSACHLSKHCEIIKIGRPRSMAIFETARSIFFWKYDRIRLESTRRRVRWHGTRPSYAIHLHGSLEKRIDLINDHVLSRAYRCSYRSLQRRRSLLRGQTGVPDRSTVSLLPSRAPRFTVSPN